MQEKIRQQSDLRFCKNGGSKRSKINENGAQIGLKIKQKIYAKCLKSVNTFWRKIRPTLGPSISGTKCDRDKSIFSAERGG